jgi:ribose transport system substrate-binding protein
MSKISKRGVSVAAVAICVAFALTGAAKAEDKKFTVAVIMPSLDISYWQWVAYGAKTKAGELGMNYMELDSHDSPTEQMSNIRTAITKGANAIVIGPVSSTSTPPVLRYLKEQNIRVA